MLGCNFQEGVITVTGDGTNKLSIVSRTDFSRFIAHVLATAPKSALEWGRFSIESDRLSPKDIAALAGAKLGKKIEIKSLDYDAAKQKYDTDIMAYMATRIADGRMVTGTPEEAKETAVKYFPDWNPTPFEAFIQ